MPPSNGVAPELDRACRGNPGVPPDRPFGVRPRVARRDRWIGPLALGFVGGMADLGRWPRLVWWGPSALGGRCDPAASTTGQVNHLVRGIRSDRANGPKHPSLGQRPRWNRRRGIGGPKARLIRRGTRACHPTRHSVCAPAWNVGIDGSGRWPWDLWGGDGGPGPLAQAGMVRAFGPRRAVRPRSVDNGTGKPFGSLGGWGCRPRDRRFVRFYRGEAGEAPTLGTSRGVGSATSRSRSQASKLPSAEAWISLCPSANP